MVAFPTFLTTALNPFYIESLKKRAYVFDTGIMPIKLAGGDQVVAWMKNESLTMDMVYMFAAVSWNGGTASRNKPCTVRGRFGISVPTAGHTAKAAGPVNGYTTDPAPLTSYVWDGVTAGGITVADKGGVAVTHINAQGCTEPPGTQQGVIVPPGGVIGCSFEPPEDGECTDIFFLTWIPHGKIV